MSACLDPDLQPTDRLLDVWARDDRQGGGGPHPLVTLALLHDGEVLGGAPLSPDDVMIVVDKAYLSSPPRVQAFLRVWYKSPDAAPTKARRLGISRSALYVEWKATLWFMRGSLRARGLHV